PDLDAVFADRDGVAGDALAVGAVAAGFLVTVGVLDVGAGLQRLAVGGDREFNGAGGKIHASFGGFAVADGNVFQQAIRCRDSLRADLDVVVARGQFVAGLALLQRVVPGDFVLGAGLVDIGIGANRVTVLGDGQCDGPGGLHHGFGLSLDPYRFAQRAGQLVGVAGTEEPATTGLGHALQLRRVGITQVEADHMQPEIDARLPRRPHRFARIAATGLQPVGDKHDAGRLLRLPQLFDRLL